MFTITCPDCKREDVPLRECYRIDEHLKCAPCFEKEHTTESERIRTGASRLSDMNTCAFCGKQKPEVSIKDMSGSPVCVACSQSLISRPFPTWVKAFFAGVVLLVGVSIAWNWRFFKAQWTLDHIRVQVETGDVEATLAGIKRFEELVPEFSGLQATRFYYQGIQALQQDSAAKALHLFEKTHDYAPGAFDLEYLITNARMGKAFDEGDYVAFFDQTKKLGDLIPEQPIRFSYLASAHACMYASTHQEAYRDSAETFLLQARDGADTATIAEYEARIRYRLFSKEIIASKEYYTRFPTGWKP